MASIIIINIGWAKCVLVWLRIGLGTELGKYHDHICRLIFSAQNNSSLQCSYQQLIRANISGTAGQASTTHSTTDYRNF